MSYTMYTPLNVWLDPASVTDVVAYIQNYLSENTIYSEEEIEELIHDYLIAHPELIGGVQSVNGKTGTVVLSASDINTANNVTIESVLASLSSQISSIAANVATNTTNITNLTGRVSTAETDISNLKSATNSKIETMFRLVNGEEPEYGWKLGSYGTNGIYSSSTSQLTTELLKIPAGVKLTATAKVTGDTAMIRAYQKNGNTFTRVFNLLSNAVTYTTTTNDYYYCFGLYHPAGNITTDYVSNISVSCDGYTLDDLISNSYVKILKVSSTSYRIDFGKYYTFLDYIDNDSINADLWDLNGVFYKDGTEVVPRNTDIIGPIQEYGASDFSGGFHGDEKTISIKITCDGTDWDTTTTTICHGIKIVLISEIYRVSDSSHIYNRFVSITITNGKMHLDVNYKCVVSDSALSRATNGGLLSMKNNILTSVFMNDYFSSTAPTASPANISNRNVSGTMYWTNGSVTVNNIVGHERSNYVGQLVVFASETPMRNKIYLDVVKTGNTSIKLGEEVLGVFEYIFN